MRPSLLPLVLLMACSSAPGDFAALRPGGFHYSAESATGQPLLTGRLQLDFADDSTFTGTWNIEWIPGADTTTPVGPQVGSGELVGLRHGTTLLIQLNPTNADHNVALQAVPRGDGYSGTWEWSTFSGPRSSGRFVAARE
jgi:hypothetical protein